MQTPMQLPIQAAMPSITQLDLPHLPVDDPAFHADPFRFEREAAKVHPWLAKTPHGYYVHQYGAMRELLGQDDKLRPPYADIVDVLGMQGTPWGRFTAEQMISLPPADHKLLRHTFAAKFTPRFANQLRPMMVETITRLLDEWVPKGAFDFEDFSAHFPISVMFALVGAPQDGIALLRDDLEAIGFAHSLQLDRFPRIQEGMVRLEQFVVDTIEERRRNPRTDAVDDLLEILIRTGDEGNISHRQLVDLIMFFFIAGYDTSKNVLTFTMRTLLDRPDIYARCAEDHDYCRNVVEEALRWFNPGTVGRVADQDIAFRDVLIPRDTMLFFPLSISGRDPTAFERADEFDPDRTINPERRHIAFALGKHMCLGQYIARAQLQEALHQVARRIRNPRLAGEVGWRPFQGSWGLTTLPIAFDAAEPTPA